VVMVALIEKIVLSRVAQLGRDIRRIGADGPDVATGQHSGGGEGSHATQDDLGGRRSAGQPHGPPADHRRAGVHHSTAAAPQADGFLPASDVGTLGKHRSRTRRISQFFYPFSWHIWELFQEARKNGCIPILVASRIHGSCFPLFKAIGILARATYGIFSEENLDEITDKTLDNAEKALLSFHKVAPGKIYRLSKESAVQGLEGLEQLLGTVVSTYFEASKKRFDQMSKKISPHINDKFQYLLDSQSSKLDVMERIARIKGILAMKLGHLNALQDVVKRQEELLKELS